MRNVQVSNCHINASFPIQNYFFLEVQASDTYFLKVIKWICLGGGAGVGS